MMSTAEQRRYVRAPERIHFPEFEKVPETKQHLHLRTLLYQILALAFRERAAIGCDQFVYWDPTDPSACLAPDAFVRLGVPDDEFRTWKVWERGAPQVAVEIGSRSDAVPDNVEEKLAKYRRLGVVELVRFDPCATEDRFVVWDNVEGDLVRRELEDPDRTTSLLGFDWIVVEHPQYGPALRLVDREGNLLPDPEELAAQKTRELERKDERIRELEAELARRR
jgi:hypothetical protein